ncbi:hypothetical protein [Nocardia sp. NPDC051750]|uniref:hypothetical protein n=1 Tax=Nocardia sp. NPDC051750 TaxID=3364325 RepID=UPI00378B784D
MNDIAERSEVLVRGPAEGPAALLGVPLPDTETGPPPLWCPTGTAGRPATGPLTTI